MAHDDQWVLWDPFKTADGLTAKQRADMERGRAWAYYANGGGGEPRDFDHETWLKMQERQR
jgi:hypothetical protein